MVAKYVLSIAITCLFPIWMQAQICADSIVIKRVQFSQDPFFSKSSISLKAGGHLYSGNQSPPDYTSTLVKTDAKDSVLYSKKIYKPGNHLVAVYRVIECAGGSVIISGIIRKFSNSIYDSSAFLAKLSPALEIVWSKEIKLPPGSFNINIGPNAVFSDAEDNIFLSLATSADYLNFSHALLAFTSSGQLLWNKGIDDNQWYFTGLYSIQDRVFLISTNYIDSLVNPVTGTYIFRSGFTCSVYDKYTGSFIGSKQIFIPSVTPFCEHSGLGSVNYDNFRANLQWNEHTKRFDYFFHEFDYKPTGAPCYPWSPFDAFSINRNIIRISFDTALNIFEPKRITGQIFYASQSDVSLLPQKKLMAFISRDSIVNPLLKNLYLTVADNNNQILFSKAVDTAITKYYTISSLAFTNRDSNVAVSFIGNPFSGRNDAIELNIPLYNDAPAYRCFTKDTVPVTFSNNVQLVNRSFMPTGLHNNVVVTNDLVLISEDLPITPQVNDICKTVSICSSLVLAGKNVFCTDKPQTFVARKNEDCLKKIVWNTDTIPATILSQTDSSITVQFSENWKGKIAASLYGCSISSGLDIEVYQKPKPLELGNDTFLCGTNTLILSAGTGYKTYRWQDGSTESSYMVSSPGQYYVTVADYCGNTYSDTILIKPVSMALNAGSDRTICKYETATLRVAGGFLNYNWWPAYALSNDNSPIVVASPETSTTYFIRAEKFAGCFAYDTITVNVANCVQNIFFPSAFTPNNDGINDVFRPVSTAPLEAYELAIYNRWGQVVFTSGNIFTGWDAKFKSADLPTGSYVWVCRYKFRGQTSVQKKGNVALIR